MKIPSTRKITNFLIKNKHVFEKCIRPLKLFFKLNGRGAPRVASKNFKFRPASRSKFKNINSKIIVLT